MRIERLEVRHLTSLSHVVLDLTTLPPGLVAIVGENGSGKTTLLESVVAGLWRTLPSRGGELVDYATDRDTTIDLRLAVDGVGAFHTRVNIDGIRRTSDAVLEFQNLPVTDGKVSTFDAEVRRRFPSLAVVLASAISAQNKRGNFISKKPKERKELFAELLALGHLEEMSVTAKAVLGLIDGVKDRVLATRKELLRLADPELAARYDADSERLTHAITDATEARRRVGVRVADLEREMQALAHTLRAHAAATERVTALSLDLDTRRAEQARLAQDGELLETQYQADLKKLTTKAAASKEAVQTKSKDTRADLDKRITAAQKVLSQAEAIRAAVAALEDLDQRERELRESLATAQAEQIEVSDKHAALDQQLALLVQPEHLLAQARQAAQLIEQVPFGGKCAEAGCQFVRGAVAAQATVPDLERRVAVRPEWTAALQHLKATLSGARVAVEALSTELGHVTQERASHQSLAALADKITVAETRITELTTTRAQAIASSTARLSELATELAEAKADLAARRTSAREALDHQAVSRAAVITKLATALERAEADVTGTADGHRQSLAVQAALAAARAEWDAVSEKLTTLTGEQATLAAQRRAYVEATDRLARLEASLARLDTERLDWQQLHKALSRDGIPVLEMDAAGPRISELTNTLLTACFGPRFSVELVTQQARASGEGMKESFELLVTDNERGGAPREVGDLSGGEQVIISEALMNAIAIFVNERSLMPIRTCWRDETTGALDPENAQRYLQMLRQVVSLGGYHQIFFVTHNPAIAAQADAQIHLADGEADVRVPPFAEAA